MTKQEMANEMVNPKTQAQMDYVNALMKKNSYKQMENRYRAWKQITKKSKR